MKRRQPIWKCYREILPVKPSTNVNWGISFEEGPDGGRHSRWEYLLAVYARYRAGRPADEAEHVGRVLREHGLPPQARYAAAEWAPPPSDSAPPSAPIHLWHEVGFGAEGYLIDAGLPWPARLKTLILSLMPWVRKVFSPEHRGGATTPGQSAPARSTVFRLPSSHRL